MPTMASNPAADSTDSPSPSNYRGFPFHQLIIFSIVTTQGITLTLSAVSHIAARRNVSQQYPLFRHPFAVSTRSSNAINSPATWSLRVRAVSTITRISTGAKYVHNHCMPCHSPCFCCVSVASNAVSSARTSSPSVVTFSVAIHLLDNRNHDTLTIASICPLRSVATLAVFRALPA
jgi:hypothetical protein